MSVLFKYLLSKSKHPFSLFFSMVDLQTARPAKRQKTKDRPLMEELNGAEDDEASSTTSSASPGGLLPVRLPQRLPVGFVASGQDGSSDAERDEEGQTETSSSSESDDSDDSEEDASSEEGPSDDAEESDFVDGATIARIVRPPVSDLRSRLQEFLPQLQQANSELERTGDVLHQQLDEVPDDAEHYIEMNLGLGVLTEEGDEAGQVKLPHSQKGDQEQAIPEAPHADVSIGLMGTKETKPTKRKIEEVG